jgi:hypothetical protein
VRAFVVSYPGKPGAFGKTHWLVYTDETHKPLCGVRADHWTSDDREGTQVECLRCRERMARISRSAFWR